jgi:hypothetical protein
MSKIIITAVALSAMMMAAPAMAITHQAGAQMTHAAPHAALVSHGKMVARTGHANVKTH